MRLFLNGRELVLKALSYSIKGITLIATIILGCESKFVESSPSSVKLEGLSLNERMSQKATVDSRIDEIQNAAKATKNALSIFKQIKNPTKNEDVYTPLDFLLEANARFKERIPEKFEDKIIRRVKIEIPTEGLSEKCKIIEAYLESRVIYGEGALEKTVLGDHLTYFMKPCDSEESGVLPIFEVRWLSSVLEFQIINGNLISLFKNILKKELASNSVCKMQYDGKNILDLIYCEHFKVEISPSEYALVRNFTFKNFGDVRFDFAADIFENETKKAVTEFKILGDGKVVKSTNKLDSAPLEQN